MELRNPHTAAGEALDRLAELLDRGVLEEGPHVAHPLVLAESDQEALRGRQRVLEQRDQRVGAGPVGARLGRAAAELLLVEPHHLARDIREDVGA